MGTDTFILFNLGRFSIGKVIVRMQIFLAGFLLILSKLTVINCQPSNVM